MCAIYVLKTVFLIFFSGSYQKVRATHRDGGHTGSETLLSHSIGEPTSHVMKCITRLIEKKNGVITEQTERRHRRLNYGCDRKKFRVRYVTRGLSRRLLQMDMKKSARALTTDQEERNQTHKALIGHVIRLVPSHGMISHGAPSTISQD